MERWDRKDVPHKGWACIDCYDLCADGEEDYSTCEMCGKERIRYIHVMKHPGFPEELRVGCICAGKMTDDYIGPRNREKELRNRSVRRGNWLKRNWRVSSKGNDFLNVQGHNIVIFPDKFRSHYWKFRIDETFGRKSYPTSSQAKIAAFDALQEQMQTEI